MIRNKIVYGLIGIIVIGTCLFMGYVLTVAFQGAGLI